MIGKKLYYELATGDVILIVPEKHSQNAINTTKEQDFQIYDVLNARNPKTVGMIQLGYGQYRGDFELANSVRVDLKTKSPIFNYPVFEPPIASEVVALRDENINLKNRLTNAEGLNILLQEQVDSLNIAMAEMMGVE